MPAEQFDERMQDYVFDVPTIPGGTLLNALTFRLEADYPFELRSMAARIPYDQNGAQNGLQLVSLRWSGPDSDYKQDAPVPLNFLLGPYFGQLGNPRPVWPPVQYPRNGVITLDVGWGGAAQVSLTGLQIFFRGVKLYPKGALSLSSPSSTYSKTMARSPLPFWYPASAQVNASLPLVTLAVTDNRLLVPFAPENDSDFVFRFGQAGPTVGTWEVFLTLRDEAQKPYSNAPIHADILFGRSVFPTAYPVGPTPNFVAAVGPGASQPGLIVPEIYIPKNHRMWFDIARNDAAYAGAAPIAYPMTFGGMKVFPG